MATNKPYNAHGLCIPPCEKKQNVLHIELQMGCPYNKCNYCKTYKGIPFRNKKLDEVVNEFELIVNILENRFESPESSPDIARIDRLYLSGADILAYPTHDLLGIIGYAKSRLEKRTSRNIRVISGYATTRSLEIASQNSLGALTEKGFNLVYWGLESGSDLVLRLANKNFKKKSVMEIAKRIKNTPLSASVNIMPGLGGIRYYREHIHDTVEVLAAISPRWVTFLAVNPAGTEYDCVIKNDPGNRHLTAAEIKTQMLEITSGIEKKLSGKEADCMVAAYDESVTSICKNPFTFRYKIGGLKNGKRN